jgi:tRNA (cytidine/uridine-2'-O-)-methyltransferase
MGLHVVLVHPEIHFNTGSVGRSCLAVGATLHLIEPLGFSLDDARVKRAGLDYWPHVAKQVWPDWETFAAQLPALGPAFFFAPRATWSLWEAPLGAGDDAVLVFGRESTGLPPAFHERYAGRFVSLPMWSPHVRSLNLSNAAAIALYETRRQQAMRGGTPQG